MRDHGRVNGARLLCRREIEQKKAHRISTSQRTLILYALTTLPLRRQEVQTRMCLLAAPTLA
jgi:hypothetical protein